MQRRHTQTAWAVGAGMATILLATSISRGQTLFEDHFDDGMMSEKWVEDGWLHTQDPTPCCSTRDSSAFVHAGDMMWTDYTIELQVDPIPTEGAWPDELERAYVLFRTRDVFYVPIGLGFTGYYLNIVGPGDVDWPFGHVHLGRGTNPGDGEKLFFEEGHTSSAPMDVRITLTGPRIQVWIDDQPVIDLIDPDPILYGGIGVATVWETHARYDDVVVTVGHGTGCDPQEVQKLLASDGSAGDKFGSQVWVDGDRAIIGAQLDDEAGTQAGSAYIFRRGNGAWMEEAKLIASDAAAIDRFGRWVAMDGDRAVVGASLHDDGGSNTGAVYVFTREGNDWIEQAKLTASDAAPGDQLGGGVGIQGDWIVAGASQNSVNGGSGPGKVYLFHLDDNDTWVEVAQLAASDGAFNDIFGFDLAIQDDVIVVAAPQANPAGSDSGAVYVFRLVEDEWIEEQKLVPTTPIAGDQFGRHVSISGDRIAGGALGGTGRAVVFRYADDEWIEEAQLVGSDVSAGDSFGNTLSLDGNQLLVSAFTHDEAGNGSGSAYLFLLDDNGTPDDPDDDSWMEVAELTAGDAAAGDNFGTDVSVSGTTAIITAQEDDDAGSSSGSAYVFELCGLDGEEATLLSFNVAGGNLVGGDLQSLEESDNDYVQIDAQLSNLGTAYVSRTLIRAKSPATTVSRLDLTLETGVDAALVTTRVFLRNFDTGDWDLLDGFTQSESDSQAMILDVPNPNAYVRDDHGQIGVQIETRANADQVPGGYIFRIDHVQIAITAGEGGAIAGGHADDDDAFACDLDGDGVVGASDLVILLGAWGLDPGGPPDFNSNGVVNAVDLLELLSNWGPCR